MFLVVFLQGKKQLTKAYLLLAGISIKNYWKKQKLQL
jgi:hypothetical protein